MVAIKHILSGYENPSPTGEQTTHSTKTRSQGMERVIWLNRYLALCS